MKNFIVVWHFALFVTIISTIAASTESKSYHIKLIQQHHHHRRRDDSSSSDNPDSLALGACTIISDDEIKNCRVLRDDNELLINKRPAIQHLAEGIKQSQHGDMIVEIFGRDRTVIQGHIDTLCKFTIPLVPLPAKPEAARTARSQREGQVTLSSPEIFKIVDSGNSSNRIDVVFMGDGYNASERQKFLDDINRLTTEMFEGVTFRSWLPLFNIWAIYVESNYSGIGYNGPEDTPFKLYRQAGELRIIYPGNATHARQVCALTGPSGCDYPSLIGNDDFYGGLGGEFVISTKSNRTGSIVLRHEMGHNFAFVGDEYDNSPTYYGVNSGSSVDTIGWNLWLSGNRREERAQYRVLAYPWANLNLGPQNFTFTSEGTYSRWYCWVSVSAAGEPDSLEFTLDGQILPWNTTGFDDREFYDWYGNQGFTSGPHVFSVRSKTPPTNPRIPRMIASVNIHEFGSESEFVQDNNHYSAYPTWGEDGRKTYRPTNAGCLMRNITHTKFCNVCKEGMWYQFLARVSLIDDIEVTGPIDGARNATVNTLKLGQWRPEGNEVEGEELNIHWSLGGIDQEQFNNQLTIQNITSGNWRVTVTLVTPEIKSDPNGLLTDSETFIVN